MQIANGYENWKVEVQDNHVVIQREHVQNEESYWETELVKPIDTESIHEIFDYLEEFIEHKDFRLAVTKDIWKYAKNCRDEDI